MARLTAVVLPILSEIDYRDKTSDGAEPQRSLILNIASGGTYGSPWLVMYGATKGFNWALSNALAMELEAERETQNVHCLCVVPGDVKSQGNSLWVTKGSPDSSTFGRLVVSRIDGAISIGWREMRPYWLHDLQCYLLRVIPESQRPGRWLT
ncbi:hypothetical protein GCG54_00001189 [Colletotrichum gloeosporioides]|uniref:Uncharacterized protein n=1 Tax=Colletotrichum gloeosporioides TaxID=474922 RepID=A0A8H4FFG4_COLGL|nr:uncharacterized protein GCG54_00001189 [Colletotrichum gloeosporioides]KAF3799084.1 hypothetical protein GCG54_00001189 [Colletotrichum gloeosporioides]